MSSTDESKFQDDGNDGEVSGDQEGGKKSKSKKNSKMGGKRKTRKLNNGAKSWNAFVMEVFRKKRASNPKYSFVQALKDASKLKKGKKSMKK